MRMYQQQASDPVTPLGQTLRAKWHTKSAVSGGNGFNNINDDGDENNKNDDDGEMVPARTNESLKIERRQQQ